MTPHFFSGFSDELEKLSAATEVHRIRSKKDPSRVYDSVTRKIPGGTRYHSYGRLFRDGKSKGAWAIAKGRDGRYQLVTRPKPSSKPVVVGTLGGAAAAGLAGALGIPKGRGLKQRLAGGAILALGGGSLGGLIGHGLKGKERREIRNAMNVAAMTSAAGKRLTPKKAPPPMKGRMVG